MTSSSKNASKPLDGIKVIEFAGLAPAPFAGLILADWGASVTRVDRTDQESSMDLLCRGKRSIAINSKIAEGREGLRKLIAHADVVIDPYRPGVLERLGLGPDVFLGSDGLNKSLIFARMAGFPRSGPHKDMAGHDINYLALSGVLSMLSGPQSKPSFPLNLLADFAGGGLMCALGILLALCQRAISGEGQVVDVDMVSGARYLASFPLIHALIPNSPFVGIGSARGTKLLDGGAPFYSVYECKDGEWMSVGCLEAQFFEVFINIFVSSLPNEHVLEKHKDDGWQPTVESREDTSQWPQLRAFLENGFRTRTRDEWARIFHGTDACALPILSPDEAARLAGTSVPQPHPNIATNVEHTANARQTNSIGQGGPSQTQVSQVPYLSPGEHTMEILRELGMSEKEVTGLINSGALGSMTPKSKL